MNGQDNLHFYYCGYEKCQGNHSFGPAVRVHYLIHFIIRGKGSYQVGPRTFQLGKNQAFLIRPREITFYEADGDEPWEYIWFAFDGREAEALVESFFGKKNPYVAFAENSSRLAQNLSAAIPCFQSRRRSQMELRGWCYLLFSCLESVQNKRGRAMTPGENRYFYEAVNFIRYNYMNDINVDRVSRHLGIDRSYLYKIIKEYTGLSPKEYITMRRIEAAKNMLQYSSYEITDIALFCGFPDHSSFCKIFRRQEGQSPSCYRKSLSRAESERKSGPSGLSGRERPREDRHSGHA